MTCHYCHTAWNRKIPDLLCPPQCRGGHPCTMDTMHYGHHSLVRPDRLGVPVCLAEGVHLFGHIHRPPLASPALLLKVPGSGVPGSSTSRSEYSVGMIGVSQGQGWRLCFFLTRQKGRRRRALVKLSTGTSSPFLPSTLTKLLVSLLNKEDMVLRGPPEGEEGQVSTLGSH